MFDWLRGKKVTRKLKGGNVQKGVALVIVKGGEHRVSLEGWGYWSWDKDFNQIRIGYDIKYAFILFVKKIHDSGFVKVRDRCVLSYNEVKKVCLENVEDHYDEYEVTERVGGLFGKKK